MKVFGLVIMPYYTHYSDGLGSGIDHIDLRAILAYVHPPTKIHIPFAFLEGIETTTLSVDGRFCVQIFMRQTTYSVLTV